MSARILLVSDYATPSGGAELTVLSLRDGLRRRGHDARLFASSARPLRLPGQADYECFGMTSGLRGLTQVVNPSAVLRLRRALREFRPDVVHVRLFLSQISPLILPLLRHIPAIYHVAGYRSICPLGTKMLPDDSSCRDPAGPACWTNGCLPARAWPALLLQMKLWRRWRDSFDAIVADSEAIRRRLEAEGIQPVEVIGNGVPARPARPPLAFPPTVGFAGRLIREKGVDVLVEAFARVQARVPGARLLIAGEGPERERIAARIERLGLRSRAFLLGHLSREDLEERLKSAWVQAVPSRWEEPFGLVAAEALMRGTAVVASRVGGLPEIVDDGRTGLLVDPADPEALAEALLPLLETPALAERLGQNGRELAMQRLTEDVFVGRFLELYGSLRGRETSARAR